MDDAVLPDGTEHPLVSHHVLWLDRVAHVTDRLRRGDRRRLADRAPPGVHRGGTQTRHRISSHVLDAVGRAYKEASPLDETLAIPAQRRADLNRLTLGDGVSPHRCHAVGTEDQ